MTCLRLTFGLTTLFCLRLAPLLTVAEPEEKPARDFNVTPVQFSSVHVDAAFWTPWLDTSRNVTIL